MQLLLDTHSLLWWVDDDPQLSPEARRRIDDVQSECYGSLIFLPGRWPSRLPPVSESSPLPLRAIFRRRGRLRIGRYAGAADQCGRPSGG